MRQERVLVENLLHPRCQWQQHVITDTGEEIMFTLDIPYVPAQDAPMVLAQAAVNSGTGSSTRQPDYLLKVCQENESAGDPTSAMRDVDPAGWLAQELGNRSNRDIYNDRTAMGS